MLTVVFVLFVFGALEMIARERTDPKNGPQKMDPKNHPVNPEQGSWTKRPYLNTKGSCRVPLH